MPTQFEGLEPSCETLDIQSRHLQRVLDFEGNPCCFLCREDSKIMNQYPTSTAEGSCE